MQIKKQFDGITLKKMGHSALLLASGAVLTYISDNVLQLIGAVGIPDAYKPIVFSVFTWLINTGKEWFKGQDSKLLGASLTET